MKNNAFPYDDCTACLGSFKDAYFCSTADMEFGTVAPESIHEGYCCGEYDDYVEGWWEQYEEPEQPIEPEEPEVETEEPLDPENPEFIEDPETPTEGSGEDPAPGDVALVENVGGGRRRL